MKSNLLGFLVVIVASPCAGAAVDPMPLPRQIRDAKTISISSQGIEPGTMDVVYDEVRKWGRWTIVDEADKADLAIILSSQSYYVGMFEMGGASAQGSATTYGRTTTAHASASSQRTSIPLIRETRFLTLVNVKTGESFMSFSCRRREINGDSRTGKTLVNDLKRRFPKDQR